MVARPIADPISVSIQSFVWEKNGTLIYPLVVFIYFFHFFVTFLLSLIYAVSS